MSATLERRYERLLRFYPAEIRRERGREMLATLLEVAGPERRRPASREVVALVLGGLRARSGADRRVSPGQIWLSAIRMAVLLLLAYASATAISWHVTRFVGVGTLGSYPRHYLLAVLFALALVAVARNRYRLGILLATTAVVASRYLAGATDGAPFYHELGELASVVAVLLAIPLLRYRPIERPSVGRWLLAVPVLFVLLTYEFSFLLYGAFGVESMPWTWFVLAIVAFGWAAVDVRVPIAVGLLLTPLLLSGLITAVTYPLTGTMLAWGAVLLAGVPGLVATGAVMARRQPQL